MKNKYGWLSLIFFGVALLCFIIFYLIEFYGKGLREELSLVLLFALLLVVGVFSSFSSIVLSMVALQKKEKKILPWILIGFWVVIVVFGFYFMGWF